MHKSQSYSKQFYIFQISKLDNFAFVSSDHFKYKSCQRVPTMKSLFILRRRCWQRRRWPRIAELKKSFTQKQKLGCFAFEGFLFCNKRHKSRFGCSPPGRLHGLFLAKTRHKSKVGCSEKELHNKFCTKAATAKFTS